MLDLKKYKHVLNFTQINKHMLDLAHISITLFFCIWHSIIAYLGNKPCQHIQQENDNQRYSLFSNEKKPSGDSRKAVYSIAAKSLDRAICIHFSYDRLNRVSSSVP